MTETALLPRALSGAYAVIFVSQRTATGQDGYGSTVSYWRSLDAIANWRRHAEHSLAREQGRAEWYEHYELQIARIERAYDWHL